MIEQYKDLLFELVDVLKSEQSLIKAFDLDGLKESGLQKSRMLDEMLKLEKEIIAKKIFEKFSDDEKFFIKNLIESFKNLMQENHEKIRYMCAVNQNATQMIFSNMGKARSEKIYYAEKGELN